MITMHALLRSSYLPFNYIWPEQIIEALVASKL
jgi:hypothetical protein